MMEILTVGLAVFKDKKILMVRPKRFEKSLFFIGGKINSDESLEEAVKRECKEEVGVDVKPESLKFLKEFEADAYAEKEGTKVRLWLFSGELSSEPVPSSEVAEIKYVNSNLQEAELNPLSEVILSWLRENHYIE